MSIEGGQGKVKRQQTSDCEFPEEEERSYPISHSNSHASPEHIIDSYREFNRAIKISFPITENQVQIQLKARATLLRLDNFLNILKFL